MVMSSIKFCIVDVQQQENVKKAFYNSFRSRCRSRLLCLSALHPQTAGPGNVKLKIWKCNWKFERNTAELVSRVRYNHGQKSLGQ